MRVNSFVQLFPDLKQHLKNSLTRAFCCAHMLAGAIDALNICAETFASFCGMRIGSNCSVVAIN
jgi:hypothetical protein